MQLQIVNRHAMGKYQELRRALETVRIALEMAAKTHKNVNQPDRDDGSGWRLPSRDEIEAAHYKATEQLTALHSSTVQWEKELVSKGWRV